MAEHSDRLGTGSLLSIGIGGMIGGGIFAVTGLAVQLTRGAAPVAFVVAGTVALLTAYSYTKLTVAFPSAGGTVEFLNRAFGPGVGTGTLVILLSLSYTILLGVYAYAFGAYGITLFPGATTWEGRLAGAAVLVVLAFLNFVGPHVVIRSENAMNVIKLALLGGFILVGLVWGHPDLGRMAAGTWVGPGALIGGAMVIFLNYEGFELIANAAPRARDLRRSMPIAYLGGVVVVMLVYVAVAVVVVGVLDFATIVQVSDRVLAVAADHLLGAAGSTAVVVAALVATSSAINATLYGSGRLTYLIAKYGELPEAFEKDIRNQPLEGLIVFTVISLLLVLFVPLNAIATMGSAGFLLVFTAVNLAALRLSDRSGANRAVAGLGALGCVVAFVALILQTVSAPATRSQVWVLVGMVAVSWFVELAYRRASGREVHMGHGRGDATTSKNPEPAGRSS